jgi:hypothetical protein
MATQQGVTTSGGVAITDYQAIKQLLETYWLPVEINHQLERTPDKEYEGTFSIWGYAELRAYPARDTGDPDHESGVTTQEFLQALSQHIAPGNTLEITSVAYTKCRHPAFGKAYEIEQNIVKESALMDGLEEVRSESTPSP